MSIYGPTQIFPPMPINEPGAPGSLVQPTFVRGDYQDFFQPANPGPALATQTTVGLGPPSKADPVFVPPNVLQVDPTTL